MDNMLASMKSGLDGLADAMGVDDSRWKISMEVSDPKKGGCVLVQIMEKTT
jgi:crossover junction endodeoxyribonuclease RusA